MSTITNAIEILKRRYYVMPLFAYKIRRRSDGLFSNGGMYPKFGPRGKTWSSIGLLNQHLALFKEYSVNVEGRRIENYVNGVFLLPKEYRDCEIVEMQLSVNSVEDVVKHLKERFPLAENL